MEPEDATSPELPRRISGKNLEDYEQEFEKLKEEQEFTYEMIVEKMINISKIAAEDSVIGRKLIEIGRSTSSVMRDQYKRASKKTENKCFMILKAI